MSAEDTAQDLLDQFREMFGYYNCALDSAVSHRADTRTLVLNVSPTRNQRQAMVSLRFNAWFVKHLDGLTLPRKVMFTRMLASLMNASSDEPLMLDLSTHSAGAAYDLLVMADQYTVTNGG